MNLKKDAMTECHESTDQDFGSGPRLNRVSGPGRIEPIGLIYG